MAKPFLHWAGGKGQLLEKLLEHVPEKIGVYHEIFLGGGALFFALQEKGMIEQAILTDSNTELIETYKQVRDNTQTLIETLEVLQQHHDEDHDGAYAEIRAWQPTLDVERAARMLYLNKTCFNGLYRVNKKGMFNVPRGTKNKVFDEIVIREAAQALKGVALHTTDYRRSLMLAGTNSFVYADPPYNPVSKTANFTGYTPDGFTQRDQNELMHLLLALDDKGVRWMLSNHLPDDTPWAEFTDRLSFYEVQARRSINSDKTKRGTVPEFIVVNTPQNT